MSAGNAPIPSVKDGEPVPIQCAHCQQQIQLTVPRIETVNQRSYSSYHFPHDDLQQCPFCGQKYLFRLLPLGKGGMSFTFMPVEEKQENRVMLANGNESTDRILKKRPQ